MLESLWKDLRFAVRMLLKTPGFTAAAVFTLALGIGANTAIFTVANAVLLRPLPYGDPDPLALITAERADQNNGTIPFSWIRYNFLKEHNRSFSGIAAFTQEIFNLTGRGDPEQLASARVSGNFFEVLGVHPVLGRTFLPDEDQPGGRPVVILSHSFWTRSFGATQSILGQSITLDSKDYTIIGVLPAGFRFAVLGATVDVWAPKVFELNLATPEQVRGGAGFLNGVARLRPGLSQTQAQAELDVLNLQYRQANQKMPDADPKLFIRTGNLQEQLVANVRPALLILFGAVGFVLLIACANVASLLLSRAVGRRKEIAIRTALGASRGSVVRQLLTESVLLSLLSGSLGMLLSQWGTRALSTLSTGNLPGIDQLGVDGSVLAFTAALSILTGLLFGLMPSLQISTPDLASVLRDEGRGTGGGRSSNFARNLLVIAEVSLSTLLLIGAGLLIRSFLELQNVAPGFDPAGVLTMNIALPTAKYPRGKPMVDFSERVREQVATIPGVRSVAVSSALPVNPTRFSPVLLEDQPRVALAELPIVAIQTITPGYLTTLRVPLMKGRDFTDHDNNPKAPVAIVNHALVKRFWPNANPIGKHLYLGRQTIATEIVGVIGDMKNISLAADPQAEIFLPFAQLPWASLYLTVRTDTDPHNFVSAIRHRVATIDKDQAITSVQTMEELLATGRAQPRLTMFLLGIFAGTALVLAAVGIYGVIAYSVAQRTQELGVRLALGASRRNILGLVMFQGLRLTIFGLGIGMIASFAMRRIMTSQVYHVSVTDPWTFAACAFIFTAIALLATYIPARRAVRVDPSEALRQ